MPYRRRRGVKRNAKTKDEYVTKKQLNKKLKTIGEVKYKVTTSNGYNAILDTGAITGVPFDVGQGALQGDRIGDKISIVAIDFRFGLFYGDTTNYVRLTIFQFHDMSDATGPFPDQDTIFEAGPLNTGQVDLFSQYDLNVKSTYTVLWDKTYKMIGNAALGYALTDTSLHVAHIKVPMTKARKTIEYDFNSGQAKNRIFFVARSDSAVGILDPTIAWSCTFSYRDV